MMSEKIHRLIITVPCKKRGKNAMKNTKKIETMQRLIQSNTGMRL
jgi:hypothetical protein